MELSDTGIDVLSVCPGPVVTEVSVNAFSTDMNTVCVCVLCVLPTFLLSCLYVYPPPF